MLFALSPWGSAEDKMDEQALCQSLENGSPRGREKYDPTDFDQVAQFRAWTPSSAASCLRFFPLACNSGAPLH